MKMIGVVAIAVALLLAVGLDAQRNRDNRGRRDDNRGPGDRRDNDDRRGRVAGIVADLERRTDEFKGALRRALDRSRMDRTRREDDLNREASKLERAANRLHESWNADRDFERSRRNLAMAISAGQDIQRAMSRHRLRGDVQREWSAVRRELNMLADVFREPPIRWE
ncbi:MAG: hypothetical protein NTY38_32875 [Acidobacteria bacterium]|nr:hypothetical protein [Acidobacteriota bacterium]